MYVLRALGLVRNRIDVSTILYVPHMFGTLVRRRCDLASATQGWNFYVARSDSVSVAVGSSNTVQESGGSPAGLSNSLDRDQRGGLDHITTDSLLVGFPLSRVRLGPLNQISVVRGKSHASTTKTMVFSTPLLIDVPLLEQGLSSPAMGGSSETSSIPGHQGHGCPQDYGRSRALRRPCRRGKTEVALHSAKEVVQRKATSIAQFRVDVAIVPSGGDVAPQKIIKMVEAVASVALEILRDLLIEEVRVLSGVGGKVDDVCRQLNAIHCFLKDASKRQDKENSVTIRNWVSALRDLANQAEIILESECLSMHQIGKETEIIKSRMIDLTKQLEFVSSKWESSLSSLDDTDWSRKTFGHGG
ncbi:putative disease resistance protein [Sesamum alatum]|uniref:Disease resistance protein n=1 Tax=Sesamum alatum TaxID=300844 RepID=A0AAE1Y7F3_9LAMI|nr:putative disease resistance protein [Sesamum alatum]